MNNRFEANKQFPDAQYIVRESIFEIFDDDEDQEQECTSNDTQDHPHSIQRSITPTSAMAAPMPPLLPSLLDHRHDPSNAEGGEHVSKRRRSSSPTPPLSSSQVSGTKLKKIPGTLLSADVPNEDGQAIMKQFIQNGINGGYEKSFMKHGKMKGFVLEFVQTAFKPGFPLHNFEINKIDVFQRKISDALKILKSYCRLLHSAGPDEEGESPPAHLAELVALYEKLSAMKEDFPGMSSQAEINLSVSKKYMNPMASANGDGIRSATRVSNQRAGHNVVSIDTTKNTKANATNASKKSTSISSLMETSKETDRLLIDLLERSVEQSQNMKMMNIHLQEVQSLSADIRTLEQEMLKALSNPNQQGNMLPLTEFLQSSLDEKKKDLAAAKSKLDKIMKS